MFFRFLFEGVSFKLTSSWPPARGKGVASCGPDATSAGSAGSAGEFQEARFYAQARANRHIYSELGVQFSTNLRKLPWAPQGTPRDPQGAQGQVEGSQVGAKIKPRHPKASPRATKASQEDKLYINKLPINRLRGRYVNIILFYIQNALVQNGLV